MDNTHYTAEHRKGQHLISEERHEIEVRLKDGWSVYRIAKHLGRSYNTIKNEIRRGTVSLYHGKVQRYKADEGRKVYSEHRQNCRKQYRCLASVRFLQYVVGHFRGEDKWSLDACVGAALKSGKFRRSETVCFPSGTSTCRKSSDAARKLKKSAKTNEISVGASKKDPKSWTFERNSVIGRSIRSLAKRTQPSLAF